MKISENYSLKKLTTFGIGGNARYFYEVDNTRELEEAVEFANSNNFPVLVLGGGSDVLIRDEGFDGVVLKLTGDKIKLAKKDNSVFLTADAGVGWDRLVEFAVNNNLQGIECLSGIPGSAGAAPIQNIGAYGQEIKDTFYTLKAYDIKENKIKNFSAAECEFGYRESVFKKPVNKGRFVISEITLKLNEAGKVQVKYDSLKSYLAEKGIDTPSLEEVRTAVIDIRKTKFENPREVGNAGSFFKNPILENDKFIKLKEKYPDMPCFDMGDGRCKCYAGWFIEKAGWKGKSYKNAAVSSRHALVLINPGGKAAAKDIKTLADKIVKDVEKKFGVALDREVQYI